MGWNTELWDRLCLTHGGLSHAVMHEAAHAVIAIKYRFEFIEVSINPDPSKHPTDVGGMAGGGVQFRTVDELLGLLASDLVGGLHFCWAGAVAENLYFEHALNGSGDADVNIWRDAASLLDGQTEDTLSAALGIPFRDVYPAVRQEVIDLDAEIRAIATALGEHPQMKLTFSDVRQLAPRAAATGGAVGFTPPDPAPRPPEGP